MFRCTLSITMTRCPRQVELYRHDEHKVRRDNVKAQHARKGRIQIVEISEHLLPGWYWTCRSSDLLLHRQEIQVRWLYSGRMRIRFHSLDNLVAIATPNKHNSNSLFGWNYICLDICLNIKTNKTRSAFHYSTYTSSHHSSPPLPSPPLPSPPLPSPPLPVHPLPSPYIPLPTPGSERLTEIC